MKLEILRHCIISGLTVAVWGVFVSAGAAFAEASAIPAPEYAKPSDVGLSSERLARLTQFIENAIEREEIPGAVLLVARHGRIVLHKGYGKLDPKASTPMPKDALFRLFSMSKPITVVAALRAAEKGALRLNDEVSRYLPAFKSMQVFDEFRVPGSHQVRLTRPARSEIVVFDLLRHMAGFADEVFYPGYVGQRFRAAKIGDSDVTLAATVDRAATLPLLYDPGTHFSYAETSMNVLGRTLEVVHGKTIDQAFKEDVFTRLGMTETGFEVAPGDANRVAQSFPMTGRDMPRAWFDPTTRRKYHSPATGLVSTALDYWRFSQMLIDNGRNASGDMFLAPPTIETMLTDAIRHAKPGLVTFFDNTAFGMSYGLGIGVKPPNSVSPLLSGRHIFFGKAAAARCSSEIENAN